MTQKELLYLEDAISHEKNIITICEDTVGRVEDENLISFINKEIQTHNELLQNLMSMFKEKANE